MHTVSYTARSLQTSTASFEHPLKLFCTGLALDPWAQRAVLLRQSRAYEARLRTVSPCVVSLFPTKWRMSENPLLAIRLFRPFAALHYLDNRVEIIGASFYTGESHSHSASPVVRFPSTLHKYYIIILEKSQTHEDSSIFKYSAGTTEQS